MDRKFFILAILVFAIVVAAGTCIILNGGEKQTDHSGDWNGMQTEYVSVSGIEYSNDSYSDGWDLNIASVDKNMFCGSISGDGIDKTAIAGSLVDDHIFFEAFIDDHVYIIAEGVFWSKDVLQVSSVVSDSTNFVMKASTVCLTRNGATVPADRYTVNTDALSEVTSSYEIKSGAIVDCGKAVAKVVSSNGGAFVLESKVIGNTNYSVCAINYSKTPASSGSGWFIYKNTDRNSYGYGMITIDGETAVSADVAYSNDHLAVYTEYFGESKIDVPDVENIVWKADVHDVMQMNGKVVRDETDVVLTILLQNDRCIYGTTQIGDKSTEFCGYLYYVEYLGWSIVADAYDNEGEFVGSLYLSLGDASDMSDPIFAGTGNEGTWMSGRMSISI